MSLLHKKNEREVEGGVKILQEIQMEEAGLSYCELRVLEMNEGKRYLFENKDMESCVVALRGKMTVKTDDQEFTALGTRKDIFSETPPDAVYITANHPVEIKSETDLTVAICSAKATKEFPIRVLKGETIQVEQRGKYANKRRVHNILHDEDDYAESLLVVEVFTDEGNWSSYPPHKHDQDNYPEETLLEEIYYHEQKPDQGFIFQRIYTDDRSIDEIMTVENGDVVVVPKGYHPVAVPDGYRSYYLNVMAGPIRKWVFKNEKNHEWILNRE